jgi:aspartate-semialdehyde dehydrogenase
VIVGVVGATGLVGREMTRVLEQLMPGRTERYMAYASDGSQGRRVIFEGREYPVETLDPGTIREGTFLLGATSAEIASVWVPQCVEAGATVVDNSSRFRMTDGVPLVVPEVNPGSITQGCRLIANPNCSTIQLVMVLGPMLRLGRIEWVAVSTYQSVSGGGSPALADLDSQQSGSSGLPRDLWFHGNILTEIGAVGSDGYCEEELKLMRETSKILGTGFPVHASVARVPVRVGHTESVTVAFSGPVGADAVAEVLSGAPGVVVESLGVPPVRTEGTDAVFVGRIRVSPSDPSVVQMWITADNVRKGAALNAVQIVRHIADRAV